MRSRYKISTATPTSRRNSLMTVESSPNLSGAVEAKTTFSALSISIPPKLERDKESLLLKKFNEAEAIHEKDASLMSFMLSSSTLMSSHSARGGGRRRRASSLSSQKSIAPLPQGKSTRQTKGRVYTGWLWKRGFRLKRWKKRFFVLRGRVLTYYKECCLIDRTHPNSPNKKNEVYQYDTRARGAIVLSSATFSNRTQFGIQITDKNGKKMYLQAENEAFRHQWLHAFVQASHIRTMSEDMDEIERLETSMSNSNSTCDSMEEESSLEREKQPEEEDTIVKQGQVYVQRLGLPRWKRVHMTLSQETVAFETSHQSGKYKSCKVLSVDPFAGYANRIRIHLDNGRQVRMRTSSPEEAMSWMHAFRRHIY